MSLYRELADLSFQALQRNDPAMAGILARILVRSWDTAMQEAHCGDKSFEKTNPRVYSQIDESMDNYITPLLSYIDGDITTPPSALALEPAYKAYLSKLKLAESE